ncbi:DUF2520 domain-containing protein [Bdellovibrio reynosensis]|uniref:DUF2520 domain-containing protein n=1 Tax=Bdellovibrio reynosensis TaxID=2835041 RepID=A0ABY4C7E9_9BACT|nr:DUF2520 domain-containing protein [Bdellovibrio reynosensis]UOF00724.1 DUF2520 domain-containing protein [Bdellovibrio reynosensis]
MQATENVSSISYLLIGSGRVARHLGHYLHLSNINYQSWDRSQDPHALGRKVAGASHVLLAISDSAIEGFYRQRLAGHDITVVQFSGAHHFEGMISAHPLMTFGPELYDLSFYKKIHFTLTGADHLNKALPGFENPFSVIEASEKALYHAYCVLGGNFTTLLAAKMLSGFAELKIPAEAAEVYLQKVLTNTLAAPDKALTGPLVRKDAATVEANLTALKNDPYQEVYKAFLKTLWPEYPRK